MIFELERKYMHHSEFTRTTQTKVFDSDMVRVECRQEFGGKYSLLVEIAEGSLRRKHPPVGP